MKNCKNVLNIQLRYKKRKTGRFYWNKLKRKVKNF